MPSQSVWCACAACTAHSAQRSACGANTVQSEPHALGCAVWTGGCQVEGCSTAVSRGRMVPCEGADLTRHCPPPITLRHHLERTCAGGLPLADREGWEGYHAMASHGTLVESGFVTGREGCARGPAGASHLKHCPPHLQ